LPVSDEFAAVLLSAGPEALDALLDDPRLDEPHVCLLLERKDLSATVLGRIAESKNWLRSRRVRSGLVAHPRSPRRIALRLAREMYVMDLVAISQRPSVPIEVRRFADEAIVARIRQLPLGQQLTLARRAASRVAGALLAAGNERVARVALDNPLLTEAQVLRTLAGASLGLNVLRPIARHPKWSCRPFVCAALARHPKATPEIILPLLTELPLRDLGELNGEKRLAPLVRDAVRREMEMRQQGE
jgi:hypothetical protein